MEYGALSGELFLEQLPKEMETVICAFAGEGITAMRCSTILLVSLLPDI